MKLHRILFHAIKEDVSALELIEKSHFEFGLSSLEPATIVALRIFARELKCLLEQCEQHTAIGHLSDSGY